MREREIMEALFRLGSGTVAEIRDALPDDASYSTVRKMLSLLEEKGRVRHREDGLRYVYEPALRPEAARRSALKHLLNTFFGGSESELLLALTRGMRLTAAERERIDKLIRRAEEEDT